MKCKTARPIRLMVIVVSLLLVMLATPAPEAAAGNDKGGWQFHLEPFYLWVMSVSGDLKVGNQSATIDASLNDVADDLNAAFIFHFEGVYKNNLGFFAEMNYLSLTIESNAEHGIKKNVDFDMALAELGGYYRVSQNQHGFDFLLGGRYVGVDGTAKAYHPGGPGQGLKIDYRKEWIDPFFGVRWIWQINKQWSLITRGDIGGFGVGSELAANGALIFSWMPWENVGFIFGYRALYINYEGDNDRDLGELKATFHGPVIGLNFSW